MPAQGGFQKYLKKAFLYHWNLLALGAGAALGIISGKPDVILPLLAAGEVLYLAGLATRGKFQAAVDAELHRAKKELQGQDADEKKKAILKALTPADRQRYEQLRDQCLQLRAISVSVRGESGLVDDLHLESINRLLWIFLKLLFSKAALERFFATIDEAEVHSGIQRAERRLREIVEVQDDKRKKSLEDTLEAARARLQNLERARANYEFIELELERLHTKIASLAEMGVNRQDPNAISTEVDSVTASVAQTERAMGELQFLTGLATDDEAPSLLQEHLAEPEKN